MDLYYDKKTVVIQKKHHLNVMVLNLKLLLTFIYHGGKLSLVKYGNQYIYIEICMKFDGEVMKKIWEGKR